MSGTFLERNGCSEKGICGLCVRLVAVNRLESCFREASVEFDRETNGIRETRREYFFSRRICQN